VKKIIFKDNQKQYILEGTVIIEESMMVKRM